MSQKPGRTKVFISYSHKDADWLERLHVHLRPLERDYHINIWDDTRLNPGSKWEEEIKKGLEAAKVAVLLVSADFLASDFIATNELPPLLEAAEKEGATILSVVLSPCRFLKTKGLSQIQSVNNPSLPLTSMSRGDQEAVFLKVAECIEAAMVVLQESETQAQAADRRPQLERESIPDVEPAPSEPAVSGPRNNLPDSSTPLIGRDREVAVAERFMRLTKMRLLTLTGPGGMGKTHLSLQVARNLIERFKDGVYFVPLDSVNDPDMVASEIARTLGVREVAGRRLIDSLKDYLADKQILLLLDNFEQLLDSAPLVAEMRKACHGLKAMVTSRSLLHISGEQEFQVKPLGLPDLNRLPDIKTLSHYPAIAMFVQRARAARPGFKLTDENARTVAEICARLDGLPLAIELAAARAKLLSTEAILSRLGHLFDLLKGGPRDLIGRHQTLHGTIAWSYDLLDENEKVLFRRLSTFVGGFTLGAAEAVCDQSDDFELDTFDGVSSLVDKSLVQAGESPEGEPRFVMLETIREYGLEALEASGEADAIRQAHINFYLALAEEAEAKLRGRQQAVWVERLERELDNLRAALSWSKESQQTKVGLRLVAALARYWEMRGYFSEGRKWLDEFLALAKSGDVLDLALAKAIKAAGTLALIQGYYDQAVTHLEKARALYRVMNDKKGLAHALNLLGLTANIERDFDRADKLLKEGMALYQQLDDKQGIAYTLNNLAIKAHQQGNLDRALQLLEKSLAIRRELGDEIDIAISLTQMGLIALDQGDLNRAESLYSEGLSLFRELGDKLRVAILLNNIGEIAQQRGDYEQARPLYEESLDLLRELGDKADTAPVLKNLGDLAAYQQDYERALALYSESLALQREVGDKSNTPACIEGLASLCSSRGEFDQAARLYGAAENLRENFGVPIPPVYRANHNRDIAQLRVALGERVFTNEFERGRATTLEQVFAWLRE